MYAAGLPPVYTRKRRVTFLLLFSADDSRLWLVPSFQASLQGCNKATITLPPLPLSYSLFFFPLHFLLGILMKFRDKTKQGETLTPINAFELDLESGEHSTRWKYTLHDLCL